MGRERRTSYSVWLVDSGVELAKVLGVETENRGRKPVSQSRMLERPLGRVLL